MEMDRIEDHSPTNLRRLLQCRCRARSLCPSLLRRAFGAEDGSVLVEMTLLTPILVSLYLGVFEFSWYFYNQQLVEAGTRDAARYMARIELTNGNTDPCTQTDANGNLYTSDAANIAVTAQTATGGTARVQGWIASNVTINCLASPALVSGFYADGSSSMTIIYATTTFADPSLGFFSALGLTTPSLSFTHQERFIGPG
jgi:Flp pilus assembly protein TadG